MSSPAIVPQPTKKKSKPKAIPLSAFQAQTPTPKTHTPNVWGSKPIVQQSGTPDPIPNTYKGPPLTHGPITGTALHLKTWITEQLTNVTSWCGVSGGYAENKGPSYKFVVAREVYDEVWTWWEAKGTVTGPNGKTYSCSATEPSAKEGRTLQIGASVQGNILATTSKAPYQTRLNLHIDIA